MNNNNNNNRLVLLIGMLLEEDHNRNYMRIERRRLRDTMNPFEMPNKHFVQIFRLDKQSVQNVITDVQDYLPTSTIPVYIQVLATLNFLATGSYQNSVGCNCWVSLGQPSISKIINKVCRVITNNLLREKVKFPTNILNKNEIKQGFFEKWGARGVLGVIDGTHVDILAPPRTDEIHPPFSYINRKGKHSINVMLISDSNTKIIGCCARYPGSVHDAAIWQLSSIRNYLRQEYENGDKKTHLLGDSGYPLEPWLFTPFANIQEGTPQSAFNNELTSVRNVIERTNGILKGRFKALSKQRMLMYHPERAANIIYTCCVLHNIAKEANLPLEEDQIEYRDEEFNQIGYNNDAGGNNILNEARAVRNLYIEQNIIN